MSRSSDRRGAVEPLAALAAVFAVCVGLGLYAGVLDGALPTNEREGVADAALASVSDAVAVRGVARPARLPRARNAGPDAYRTNATLVTADRRWSYGPTPPDGARSASHTTSVRIGPADVRPGTLRVEVWA